MACDTGGKGVNVESTVVESEPFQGTDTIGKLWANGQLDVVVTDGFSGNVALKMAEGISSMFTRLLRRSLNKSFLSRLGYLLARSALSKMRTHIDPRHYNGAVFLGLNGIAIGQGMYWRIKIGHFCAVNSDDMSTFLTNYSKLYYLLRLNQPNI